VWCGELQRHFFLERDNYITGQAVAIDGGLRLHFDRA
jgi:hypothetical protein